MSENARTIAFLSQLARGTIGNVDLVQLLAPGHVCICVGTTALTHPQGQLLLSFAVNLLARLHPVIQHLSVCIPGDAEFVAAVPRWRHRSLREHVASMTSAIAPLLSWDIVDRPSPAADETLVVGEATASTLNQVYVGSDGWRVLLSPDGAVPVTGAPNPIGAYGAACFGVAEIVKRLLARYPSILNAVPIVPLTQALSFSTFTYLLGDSGDNPPLPDTIDLGRFSMIGLGAGGGASAYTLASLPTLRGSCSLVDPDSIEGTNLNRYVFADEPDAALGVPKADVVAKLFERHPDFHPAALPEAFQQAASHLSEEDVRFVVAAAHSREARREIQRETPMVLWDAAAAEDGEFRIWRLILGTTECMFCKHPSGADDPEERKARQVSKLLGLDATTCLRKLRNHEPFEAIECASIRQRIGTLPIPFDLPTPGLRFNDWETAQCGRLSLPDADDEVPIPFAPVMAGVLIAGELIKERYFPEGVLRSMYWNTLLGKFMVTNPPRIRAPRAGCRFCTDRAYLDQYARRWAR